MKRWVCLWLLGSAALPVSADNKAIALAGSAHWSEARFASVLVNGLEEWSATLVDRRGQVKRLPDVCEYAGGEAEVVDAYIARLPEEHFVFVCRWRLNHRGLNIVGNMYDAFAYRLKAGHAVRRNEKASYAIAGYEGTLEQGGNAYYWYDDRSFAVRKLKEVIRGQDQDSLGLAVDIVLRRLAQHDKEAVIGYLAEARVEELLTAYPLVRGNVAQYNNLGFALSEAGNPAAGLVLLKKVEAIAPTRTVLKLNIADALWALGQSESSRYYREYLKAMEREGKTALIPERVAVRGQQG